MKPIVTLLICSVLLAACKKEITATNGNEYLKNVKAALKDSMSGSDFSNLDFTKAIVNRVDSVSLYFMRVPFKGKSIEGDFVLVKTEKDGRVKEGRVVHLEGNMKQRAFYGNVSISALNRAHVLSSVIDKGYIVVLHKDWSTREQLMEAAMPEVVIVTYVNHTPDYSTWLWLNSFFYINSYGGVGGSDGGGGAGGGGYYGSLGGNTGGYTGGGSGGTYGSGGGSTVDPTILIDVDTYVNQPAINVDQYLKCFTSIPDQGSICSVEIFTDIPVDNDPTKLFNWNTESPGHTFLQLKKSNADGTQMVIQNIGFYPRSTWKNILDANPVDSKMVDDGDHEFNASLKMSLSPNSFSSVLGKIKELSTMKYDVDEFNCTDFALEVFNYVRTPLQIPQYEIPGGIGTIASNTPQGLYIKLREMKNSNDPESANIMLPGVKGWVSNSNGPCN